MSLANVKAEDLVGIVLEKELKDTELKGARTFGKMAKVLDKTPSGLWTVSFYRGEQEHYVELEQTESEPVVEALQSVNMFSNHIEDVIYDSLRSRKLAKGVVIFPRHLEDDPSGFGNLLFSYMRLNIGYRPILRFDEDYQKLFGKHFDRYSKHA